MRHVLSPRNCRVLAKFAASDTLVALDFDGTLAPIVRDRRRAALRTSTKKLLAVVARLYPCAVISGRSRADVRRRLRGIRIREIVGNHGIEPWGASRSLRETVRHWLPPLLVLRKQFPGIAVEDKRFSLAVHYRHERRKKKARAAILDVARELDRVRLVGGKMVWNFLPSGAPHKGTALERALQELCCRKAIYIGDDDTDEDVFSLTRRSRLFTVRIGRSRASRATSYLRRQAEIDSILKELIRLRSAAASRA